jgi:sugar lactone lactonase YvrE
MRFRNVAATFAITAMMLASNGIAHAVGDTQTVVTFDASKGELPEGLAIDKHGNFFVSMPPLGEVRKITPSGQQSVIARFDVGGGLGPLGLALDAVGNVYVGLVTFDPATQGVYRIGAGGAVTRLPGTDGIGFANGLTFDDRGDLFVADSTGGAVWKIPAGGSAQPWAQGSLLQGTGVLGTGFPIGANGIAYRNRSVIVDNTEQGSLLRFPVLPDGSAGEPHVIAQDPALFGADGVAVDVHGAVYVAVIIQSTIVRVEGGSIETLADEAAGLNEASSITFGTRGGDRKDLYAVNFGVFSPTPTPALLKMNVGVPGAPLP